MNHTNIIVILVLVAILIPGWGILPVVAGFVFLEAVNIVIANTQHHRRV